MPFGVAHVEGDAPLAHVVVVEARAAVHAGHAELGVAGVGAGGVVAGHLVVGAAGAEDVELAFPLDVDDVGAVEREVARPLRPGVEPGEVQDARAFQGQRHGGSLLAGSVGDYSGASAGLSSLGVGVAACGTLFLEETLCSPEGRVLEVGRAPPPPALTPTLSRSIHPAGEGAEGRAPFGRRRA